MKAFDLLMLLGSASMVQAVREARKHRKQVVEIELNQVNYEPDRDFFQTAQLDDEYMMQLHAMYPPQMKTMGLIQKEIETIDMKNLMNMGYEGKFWFGNPSQEMEVIFDTGSAWAWVFSEKCANNNCPAQNQKYFQTKSKEFKNNPKAAQFLQYGKGKVLGNPAEDRACFSGTEKHCLSKFNFLTVVKAADVEALKGGGLIGLAPTPVSGEEFKDPMHKGVPGFVAQLQHSTQYKDQFDPVFSFYLSNEVTEPGKMLFGGVDYAKYAKAGLSEKDVFWAKQSENKMYWAVDNSGVKFGQADIASKHQQVILDNGMSFAMAPQASFFSFVTQLFKQHGIMCFQMQPVWGCKCNAEQYNALPALDFNFHGMSSDSKQSFKMPKESYMMHKQKGENEMCFLLISPWNFAGLGKKNATDEYWILGAQFLHNYYSVYNFQEGKIGLVESKSSRIGRPTSSPILKKSKAKEEATMDPSPEQQEPQATVQKRSH